MNGHWLWAGAVAMLAARLCLCLVYEPEELRERRDTSWHIWVMTAFGAWCGYAYSDVLNILLSLLFGILLFWGATIDKRYWILPNSGAVLLVLLGVVRIVWQFHSLEGQELMMTVGAAVLASSITAVGLWLLGMVLRRLTKNGVGRGDIKWIAALAFWFSRMCFGSCYCWHFPPVLFGAWRLVIDVAFVPSCPSVLFCAARHWWRTCVAFRLWPGMACKGGEVDVG